MGHTWRKVWPGGRCGQGLLECGSVEGWEERYPGIVLPSLILSSRSEVRFEVEMRPPMVPARKDELPFWYVSGAGVSFRLEYMLPAARELWLKRPAGGSLTGRYRSNCGSGYEPGPGTCLNVRTCTSRPVMFLLVDILPPEGDSRAGAP